MRNLRRIVRWCRYVLPPWNFLLAGVLVVCVFELIYWGFFKQFGFPDVDREFEKIRLMIAGFLCFFYGGWRMGMFHPLFNSSYRKWLSVTPWSSRKPLPFGPLHLVGQDLLLLGLVYLYIFPYPHALPVVILGFLGPYFALLGYSFFRTGVWQFGYLLVFGVGTVVLFAENLWAATACMIGCYAIAWWGMRSMLSRFPWEEVDLSRLNTPPSSSAKNQPYDRSLGWHFERLAPLAKIFNVSRPHNILFPLTAGWLCFVSTIHTQDEKSQKVCFFLAYFIPCIALLAARLGFYCFYYHNPLRLFGRIFPGPLIVPRYDKVFLVPLGMVVFAVAAPLLLMQLALNFALLLAVSLTLVLYLAINGKPTLKNWALTGGHRIANWPRRMTKIRV
ncbi:MAG: hypothetical protein JXB10_03895 [Pirellulales bacterium]|nr:hypothetical protein [Pirellulales bacterium]